MKCVSLWQPWASLLFSPGEYRKEFETRPRAMGLKAGETIAIQAAKTQDGINHVIEWLSARERKHFQDSLQAQFGDCYWSLPLGSILGTVKIGTIHRVEEIRDVITPQERAFGDWRDGRFAIETLEPRKFETPIEYTGQQGVFFVPDNVIARAA